MTRTSLHPCNVDAYPPYVVAGVSLVAILAAVAAVSSWRSPHASSLRSFFDGLAPSHMPPVALSGVAINSFPDTTGPGVAAAIVSSVLAHGRVDEAAVDMIGSTDAVKALAAACAAGAGAGVARDAGLTLPCFDSIGFARTPPALPARFDLDVVIPTIRSLDFLEAWRAVLEPYHLIIIQDGDPDVPITVPAWADYELHNRRSIDAALGADSWIISSRDSALRSYGFLVSRARYIFTLDDDTLPSPQYADPVRAHMWNLKTNSTPFYFNTLYDSYRAGTDFVRGYPYSLRMGVPTVVSHGLWLHTPDYDAPTQLLKPIERNEHVVDTAVTVPRGILYPMCGMNLAFDRERAGVLMLFGLMGDGQPWGRYDDMIAGWASKVCVDRLSLGVKSGTPYTVHKKASDPFVNLRKEYMGLSWQEDIIRFFDAVHLSDAAAASPEACYLELADKWEAGLGHLNAYFPRFARAMRAWTRLWVRRQEGKLDLPPVRKSALKE